MIIPFRHKDSDTPPEEPYKIPTENFEEPTPLLKFIFRNSRIIIGCLLLVFCVLIIFGLWNWYTIQEERKAQTELGRILVKPLSLETFNELEQLEKTVPSSLRKGVLLQLAFWSVQLEQLQKAVETYGVLFTEDPKGAIGILSGLNQSDLLQRLGNWREALTILTKLEKVASSPILTAVYEAQGVCAEQLGEQAIAASAYKKLVDELLASGVESSFYEDKLAALTND